MILREAHIPERVVDMPRRLRIALVAARYFPYMGGTETHIHEVSRRMSEAGHDVTILTSDVSGKLPPEEIVNGVTVRRFPAYPRGMDLYYTPRLYRAVTEGGWDVVHCQGYHTFVAPMAMLAARRAKIPYVVTFHSGGHSSALRNAVRGIQRNALRPLIKDAAQLIGVSDFEADFFSRGLHLPRERFVVIPNGAQLPEVQTPIARNSAEPLILSVGRLEKYKGHQRVLRAMPRVLAAFPKARLRIVGSGPYEKRLRELTNELGLGGSVEIGSIPPGERSAMATLMSGAALVTLISDYEAHPVTVMEALALRRPVLVADNAGLAELARRGLVPCVPADCDDECLAAAIIEQLYHPFISDAAVEFPTWEACTEKLLDVYMRVAGIPA